MLQCHFALQRQIPRFQILIFETTKRVAIAFTPLEPRKIFSHNIQMESIGEFPPLLRQKLVMLEGQGDFGKLKESKGYSMRQEMVSQQ